MAPSDRLVVRFRRALARLKVKCREPAARLSDFAVNSQQIMKDDAGIEESLLSILQQVDGSIPRSLGPTRCQDIFAAYVTLREAG